MIGSYHENGAVGYTLLRGLTLRRIAGASCMTSNDYAEVSAPERGRGPHTFNLESAILTAVLRKSTNPRWSGRLCAKAFTEKLKFLMQHLTMTTAANDPLPLFCRILVDSISPRLAGHDVGPKLRQNRFKYRATPRRNAGFTAYPTPPAKLQHFHAHRDPGSH